MAGLPGTSRAPRALGADMRATLVPRVLPILAAASAAVFLVSSGQPGLAGAIRPVAGGPPVLARSTGRAILGTAARPQPAGARATGLPSKKQQIKVLTAVLERMHDDYSKLSRFVPGPGDVFDYNIGALWRKGIDGAGTTVAVMEGWDYPAIASVVAGFDKNFGLPNPQITTIFPAGPLPKKCPPGMVKLGSYGSCQAWQGELALDVISAHLMAPYAKIVISATPADTEVTDDAAFQVAPPEMMKALEFIAAHHVANTI